MICWFLLSLLRYPPLLLIYGFSFSYKYERFRRFVCFSIMLYNVVVCKWHDTGLVFRTMCQERYYYYYIPTLRIYNVLSEQECSTRCDFDIEQEQYIPNRKGSTLVCLHFFGPNGYPKWLRPDNQFIVPIIISPVLFLHMFSGGTLSNSSWAGSGHAQAKKKKKRKRKRVPTGIRIDELCTPSQSSKRHHTFNLPAGVIKKNL